jgi:UDP-3-O-[3-hydroxymyristoyl] N-acetylglucosamine deacetylase
VIRGIAIHSGRISAVHLHRDEGPVRFRCGRQEVLADIDRVVATERCTVLAEGGARVALVEHLLAALHAAGFWRDLVIEVDGEELPILDGSAQAWSEAVAALGEPPPPPPPLEPIGPIDVTAKGGRMRLQPGERTLCAAIDFAHPAIGAQRWCGGPESWAETLEARTFGFLAEAEALQRAGFAIGATLENAIVFGDDGPLRPLRFTDEPVRHKALDALGDLFLMGAPIDGSIAIERGSHTLHIAFAREMRRRLGTEVTP